MKFLVTNDDGIDAPGLQATEHALESLGELYVMAPDQARSGCSHQATTGQPLKLTTLAERRYSLDGTPVDCIRIGLLQLGIAADWIISGINQGGNLGCDVLMSGTVAAAREACLLGRPGMAFSQYRRRRADVDWRRAARWTRHVVGLLLARHHQPGTFWNVNLPDLEPGEDVDVPEIVFCPVDPHPLPVRYREANGWLHYESNYHGRDRLANYDVDLCFSGSITVSQLGLPRSM